MTTETPDLQAIVERLERLEKQDVRLKRAGLSVLLVVSAALLMGQARPFRTVEAEGFILRDVSGKRRATLAVAADESVSLTLGDSTGTVRASLSVGKPGASLDFADPNGKVKETFSDEGLMFFDNAGDPRVALWHIRNSPSLDLYAPNRENRVSLQAVADGATLILGDKEGYKAELGSTWLVMPQTGQGRRSSAAYIVLSGKDGKVLWSAP